MSVTRLDVQGPSHVMLSLGPLHVASSTTATTTQVPRENDQHLLIGQKARPLPPTYPTSLSPKVLLCQHSSCG